MSPKEIDLAEIQKSLTVIDASLRRIALALESIAHKTDEHFKTRAETQREQAPQHVAKNPPPSESRAITPAPLNGERFLRRFGSSRATLQEIEIVMRDQRVCMSLILKPPR
jgi:hypothetical protein